MSKGLVVAITGPTASGKTKLATMLYDKLDIELINMDSVQIYRDMNIGSAKPSVSELIKYPHHLVDICSPTKSYSVNSFVVDANKLITSIIERGKIPVLVGGTMLYYKGLSEGLADLPSADYSLRKELYNTINQYGHKVLFDELNRIDPETASRIQGNDTQRLIRFIEIARLTKKAPSDFFKSQIRGSNFDFFHIAFLPDDRIKLHEIIEKRFDSMLSAGIVDEVSELIKKYPKLTNKHQSMRCVGYRQVWDYLDLKINSSEMREKAIIATRQLAKRQYTWLRKLNKDIVIHDPYDFSLSEIINTLQIKNKKVF